MALDELPDIHVVLISHNHYDHLDVDSVRRLHARYGDTLRFLVPLGLKPWFAGIGIGNVSEHDWWDHIDLTTNRRANSPRRAGPPAWRTMPSSC